MNNSSAMELTSSYIQFFKTISTTNIFGKIHYEDKQTRGACILAAWPTWMVFIFLVCKLWKLCQEQVKLPEFSLPVALLVNHFLASAVTISIVRAWNFHLLQTCLPMPHLTPWVPMSNKLFTIFTKVTELCCIFPPPSNCIWGDCKKKWY